MRHILLALSLAILPFNSSLADENDLETQLANAFMEASGPTFPNPEQVEADYRQLGRVTTYKLGNTPLTTTTGSSSPAGGGLVLFTHNPTKAYILGGGSSVYKLYSTPDERQLAVLFMVTSEGPGPLEMFILNRNTSPETIHSITLTAPDAINKGGWKMEYIEPESFNIDATGHGTLYASATIDGAMGNTSTLWFRYTSQDGGKTWSDPVDLATPPDLKIMGIYQLAD